MYDTKARYFAFASSSLLQHLWCAFKACLLAFSPIAMGRSDPALKQLQEERNTKGELKQLLTSTVQSERAAEKKLADVSAELEAASSRLAKAEAALQVSFGPRPCAPELHILSILRSSPDT